MNPIDRRVFLKYLGAAAGTAALPSAVSAVFAPGHAPAPAHKNLTARIGVMVPESEKYPLMAHNFLAGLNLHFEGSRVEIITEKIGSSLPSVNLRRLIRDERVDLVIGMVNSGVAASLVRPADSDSSVFIASNVGEVMPRAGEQSPNLFHCTLNYWQAGWAMGRWAAANLGKRACISSSLHDSGYDGLYAFRLGFESAGGRISDMFVTHTPEQVSETLRKLGHIRPDFVYTAYSGPDAAEFLTLYRNSTIGGRIPVAGAAFLLDTADTPEPGKTAEYINICSPFGPAAERAAFDRTCLEKTGSAADVFSLLGYETAKCIATAIEAAGGNAARTAALLKTLKTVSFEGTRGRIEMDPASHATSGPLYMGGRRLHGLPNGEIRGLQRSISVGDARMRPLYTSVRSGWNNSYLCV